MYNYIKDVNNNDVNNNNNNNNNHNLTTIQKQRYQKKHQSIHNSIDYLQSFKIDQNIISRLCFIIVATFKSELIEEHISFHTTSLTFTTGLYLLSIQTTIYPYNPILNIAPNKDPITRSLNKILIMTISNCCFNYTLNITLSTLQELFGVLLNLGDGDGDGDDRNNGNNRKLGKLLLNSGNNSNNNNNNNNGDNNHDNTENLYYRTISLICRAISKISKHFNEKHFILKKQNEINEEQNNDDDELYHHNNMNNMNNNVDSTNKPQFVSQYIQYGSIFPLLIDIYNIIDSSHIPYLSRLDDKVGNNDNNNDHNDKLYQAFRDIYACFPLNDTKEQCFADLDQSYIDFEQQNNHNQQNNEQNSEKKQFLFQSITNFWKLYQKSPQSVMMMGVNTNGQQ
jgi:hypothetical protein